MNNEDILMAFKNGNVPEKGVTSLCVGRENELNEFSNLLDKVKNDNKAFTKFINGEFGTGKSFFLKALEEMAFENNFVVAKITIGNDIPFNKIDIVYKNIAKTLKCKTGEGLNHVIDRWITSLTSLALNETDSLHERNEFIKNELNNSLKETRSHSNSFAIAIENYYKLSNGGNNTDADYAMAWLRGDSNIPFVNKKKFGVKGDITKENALDFLEALSIFIKIQYSGLVILIDEAEFIMNIHTAKSRDIAYDYIRKIMDYCSEGKFENSLFVFAGTPKFFEDEKKGIRSYSPLQDRIENPIKSNLADFRNPIIPLNGFEKEDLVQIARNILEMHAKVYDWNPNSKINPIFDDIININLERFNMLGGKVIPRLFVRSFITVLDLVNQNPSNFEDLNEILKLFDEEIKIDEWDDEEW